MQFSLIDGVIQEKGLYGQAPEYNQEILVKNKVVRKKFEITFFI